jgi:hypothetical protein
MGWFPYGEVNWGFPWFMLIMPLLCLGMMFFFCRIGFHRESARAVNCWHRWDYRDGMADEVVALRKELELLKQKNR